MRAFGFVLLVLVLSSPSIAAAGFPPPDPLYCTLPCGINLVGTTGGVPAIQGEFFVQIKSGPLPSDVIPGASVVIDFSGCSPDIHLCSTQPWTGIMVGCSPPVGRIGTVTDATGRAVLRIVGGASNFGGNTPAFPGKCARIFADGVFLGNLNVGAYDQNGSGGVNPADISVFLDDSLDPDFEGRSDFDCSGAVNPADLSLLLGVALSGTSSTSCSAYCF